MSHQYEKLKTLLKELFQLDQPDLDFGLYRIMHAKSAEVTQFLDNDLLPQVKTAFAAYKTADKAELEKELTTAIEQARGLGVDPESTQKVKDLRARLKLDAVDVHALEREVYDHLFGFFRRYYSEGDFLAKRVYKPGVYAIPYEGEEVTLHWANKDQYYIKTSEYLRDYAFRLRPDDDKRPMRVHFRLIDAAEGEHGNVKAVEGKERVFVLAARGASGRDFIAEVDGEHGKELVLQFEYRPGTLSDWPDDSREGKAKPPAQKDLIALAVRSVLEVSEPSLAAWIAELDKPHVMSDGQKADYSRLEAHVRRYAARNTFDYFIHKDLGGFLRRELDFYIKNEVMHLDDVENESAPRVEQYLSKIKVIRKIAGKIIEFLAQLEEFQKKLWLKKKFVVETQYCITLGCIPETFYTQIAASDVQRKEWVRLFAINEIKGDLAISGYSEPLTAAFLKAHPTLVVDTKNFDGNFRARLLETVGDLDGQTDGVLFHSENHQALRLVQRRYRDQIRCIYIDPPYNTGNDAFAYKDMYRHASWLSMIHDRLDLSITMLDPSGSIFSSIDDGESFRLRFQLERVFGESGFLGEIIWQKRYAPDVRTAISDAHEYVIAFAKNVELFKVSRNKLPLTVAQTSQFKNPDNDVRGPWKADNFTAPGFRPNQMYEIRTIGGRTVTPPAGRCWGVTEPVFRQFEAEGLMYYGADGTGLPAVKRFLRDMDGMVPWTWWPHQEVGHSQDGLKEVMRLLGREDGFSTAKPSALLERIVRIAASGDSIVLDYFAGSGTTGHAVINLNREDSGRRRFVLVEVGDYFETVLLPRIKKVTFAPEWKDGKPERFSTKEEADRGPRIVKVMRLESYEDALNNLKAGRTPAQQTLLSAPAAQGAAGLKEEYTLSYMLDVETRGSQSLLSVGAFSDPTAYKLKVKRPGSDESREVNVDLLETFNWLIGLKVRHIAAPQTFNAVFARNPEQRLHLKGVLKPESAGPYWFRTVIGTTPEGRKTLVIWRKLTGDAEQDNLVLDAWFTKQGYSTKDFEFNLIYVNGGNNLENLKTPDDTWKVRLIEEDFHRLMFETDGV